MKLPEIGKSSKGGKPYSHLIYENLHGHRLVDMVAELFAGASDLTRDVSRIAIEKIDWANVNRPREKNDAPKGQTHPGAKRPRQ